MLSLRHHGYRAMPLRRVDSLGRQQGLVAQQANMSRDSAFYSRSWHRFERLHMRQRQAFVPRALLDGGRKRIETPPGEGIREGGANRWRTSSIAKVYRQTAEQRTPPP